MEHSAYFPVGSADRMNGWPQASRPPLAASGQPAYTRCGPGRSRWAQRSQRALGRLRVQPLSKPLGRIPIARRGALELDSRFSLGQPGRAGPAHCGAWHAASWAVPTSTAVLTSTPGSGCASPREPRLRAPQPLKQFMTANSAGPAHQRPPPKWASPLAGFAAANPASRIHP